MKYTVLIGRILFAAIFVMSGLSHLFGQGIDMAAQSGVPLASIAVPLSGLIVLLGGLSVLVGFNAKWGAWLIVLFLVPVTFFMHNFWGESDPVAAQTHMAMFMKNVSLIGAALLIAQFGSGPFSLDTLKRSAEHAAA